MTAISRSAKVIRPTAAPSNIIPALGTKARAESFIRSELSAYGDGVAYASYLMEQFPELTKASEIAREMHKHLAGFGYLPADVGVKTLKGRVEVTAMQLAACRCVDKVERAAERAFKLQAAALVASTVDSDSEAGAGAGAGAAVTKLDEKGKTVKPGMEALKGVTAKAELARLFAEMQQAVIEENLSKLSDLILEGQKIIAIAK